MEFKQTIFTNGKGWYIPLNDEKVKSNKEREESKDEPRSLTVWFGYKGSAPDYTLNQRGWAMKKIIIGGHKFTLYNGKPELVIFEYQVVDEEQPAEDQNEEFNRSLDGTKYADEFDPKVKIEEKELPFY